MLRPLKLSLLRASRTAGLFRLARNSRPRTQRLLILCYHGISIDDEHEWAPGLYMSQDAFASRLTLLQRGGYAVLPLDEAVRRLYDGTLPPRSVAITFDDGNFDFYSRAWPVLQAAGMPATVWSGTTCPFSTRFRLTCSEVSAGTRMLIACSAGSTSGDPGNAKRSVRLVPPVTM